MKKLNSIFDTESKIIQFMGSNKYIITQIECRPVFKQDPKFPLPCCLHKSSIVLFVRTAEHKRFSIRARQFGEPCASEGPSHCCCSLYFTTCCVNYFA